MPCLYPRFFLLLNGIYTLEVYEFSSFYSFESIWLEKKILTSISMICKVVFLPHTRIYHENIMFFAAIPLKLIIKFATVQRRKKPEKPMENVSFTWSTAVSVLEPASPCGNCEFPSWRVLGVEVSVLKNMNMLTKTRTMPIIKAVMMIALPSHVDPTNFYGGFMVHWALAL